MESKKSLLFFSLAVLASHLVPAPAMAWETFPPDGPYPVGVRMDYAEYEGRKMPIVTWYPAADSSAGAVPHDYQGIQGHAVWEAPPRAGDGPYPLILFSHGMGACAIQSVFYTENLASHGYVVVAPDHMDSAMCHSDGPPDVTPGQITWAALKSGFDLGGAVTELFKDKFEESGYDFSYRPREASAAIDRALAWNADSSYPLHGLSDPDRIGATGHSLGGYTSMMIGGVPFKCDPDNPPDPLQCDPETANIDHRPDPCCMEFVREADPMEFRDERVKAIVPLGPAVFFPDLEEAAKQVEIPVMIITGDSKNMEVPLEPIMTFYENAPPPQYVVVLKNTDHMTIADMTMNVSAARLVLPGFRYGFKRKAQAYKDYSAEFFDYYLKGEGDGLPDFAIHADRGEYLKKE